MAYSYTCVVCPLSCVVELEEQGSDQYKVSGNRCKRGEAYAISEHTCPKRMLTTTVAIENGLYANVPVVSEEEIEKDKLRACLAYLYKIQVKAPIKEGDLVVENILGTNVNIIAARDMAVKI